MSLDNNDSPPAVEDRHGFLPINTNAFDRVFISVVLLVAIHLLWMRFLEASFPLEIATILSILIGILIVRKDDTCHCHFPATGHHHHRKVRNT
jgi:predicted small integral membrane protein